MKLTLWQTLSGLLMHNIPVFILAIALWISWRYEIVGGIIFTLAGLLYTVRILINIGKGSFQWYMISWILVISGPAFLIGILFTINWFKKR